MRGCWEPYQMLSLPHRTLSSPKWRNSLPITWAASDRPAYQRKPGGAQLRIDVPTGTDAVLPAGVNQPVDAVVRRRLGIRSFGWRAEVTELEPGVVDEELKIGETPSQPVQCP